MTTKKVSELTGAELDKWVARAHGMMLYHEDWQPSQNWAQGGPLIEQANIQLTPPTSRVHRNGGLQPGWGPSGLWSAVIWQRGPDGHRPWAYHETSPLIAAMRCYVISRLALEVNDEG